MYDIISTNDDQIVVKMDALSWRKCLRYVDFDEDTPETYQIYTPEGVDPRDILSSYMHTDGQTTSQIYSKKSS